MGKRGPKKTPAPIKKARGTYRKDRDAGVDIAPANCVPSPPWFLSENAVELWKSLGPKLYELKLLTDADVLAFALLCQAWDDWIQAIQQCQHSGIVSCGDSGNEYQHPAVGVRNRAWAMVLKGCQEFGLTPSARTGAIVPTGGDDPADGDPRTRRILGID